MELIQLASEDAKRGWRCWTIELVDGSPRLIGLSSGGRVWTPGVVSTDAPWADDDTEGIWVISDRAWAADQGQAVGAYGAVDTYGWLANRDGKWTVWSAEHAQLVELLVAVRHCDHIPALAEHYGVPVSTNTALADRFPTSTPA